MRFHDDLQRLIAGQVQDAPVGLGRSVEVVIGFLQKAQANGGQDNGEDRARGLAERNGLGKCPAGRGALTPENVGIPLRPQRAATPNGVARMQQLQGTV